MVRIKSKRFWKFIIYPILLALINLLIVKFVMKYYISHMDVDINHILSDQAISFDHKISSIFDYSSNDEVGDINKNDIIFPKVNEEYGNFEVQSISMSCPLIFGDGKEALQIGVGQYSGSYIPGYGGTILLTGHNYVFPEIQNVKLNDIIKITTSYGIYKYKISDIKVLDKDQYSSLAINCNKEQLIYYTCYPFDALGSISTRYFIYADYLSGPKIVNK